MYIEAIRINNFRCIQAATLKLDDMTVLVGANGAGKSTFLRAMELFFSPSTNLTVDDFFNKDTTNRIAIALIFRDLSDEAKERFQKYVQGNELIVEMWGECTNEKFNVTFHGSKKQNPDFHEIRETAERSKQDARRIYNELRQQEKYCDLPSANSYDQISDALQNWETQNPNHSQNLPDDGQFFGFKSVGRGYLQDYVRFLFISAVRDASQDAVEGRNTVITQLMDLAVRTTLESRDEVVDFRKETSARYEAIMNPENLPELGDLRQQLVGTLQTFVPTASVELEWQKLQKLDIPMPKASIDLVEDGFRSRVEMAGHGLQRAFIFTLLQHLALAQQTRTFEVGGVEDSKTADLPTLIIAIEEPELYQHPNRQRHFAKVLRKLACGKIRGVTPRMQLICATHSPLFIDIEQFDSVRLVRKTENNDAPKSSQINHALRDAIVRRMQEVKNDMHYTRSKLELSLPQLMTPYLNEGFFGDIAVVVEGESDRAVLLEVARQEGHDLESLGIAIVPVGGKGNLLIPSLIFSHLGIPVYLMWDNDQQHDSAALLRYVGHNQTRISQNTMGSHFYCFAPDREQTMKSEINANAFERLCNQCRAELGDKNLKNALVARHLVQLMYTEERKSQTLVSIVNDIIRLRQAQPN